VDVILYALVAVGLVFWLRGLLGTRQDGERQRPNPFAEAEKIQSKPLQKPISVLPSPRAETGLLPDGTVDVRAGLDRNMAVMDKAQGGLSDITRADRGFETAHFLTGAQDAFTMIVGAFASGDRDTLKNLLAESVYKSFDGAIAAREKAGEQAQVEIHAIRRAEVVNAWLAGRTAFITVRFVADETNILKDSAGTLLHGNPDRITETIDIWTFSRDIRSKTPGWFVCETRDEDAAATDHKTVPDATPPV
jgi:predicted lipid-binding transport protein (Tim44 family)